MRAMKSEGNCGNHREENTGEQMACSRIQGWELMFFSQNLRGKPMRENAIVQGILLRRLVLVLCEDNTLFLLVNLGMNKERMELRNQIT